MGAKCCEAAELKLQFGLSSWVPTAAGAGPRFEVTQVCVCCSAVPTSRDTVLQRLSKWHGRGRGQRHLLSQFPDWQRCAFPLVSVVAYKCFCLVCPSPFLSFWLLTQLQTEPVWLYERHFLLVLFFKSASAHQLLSISVTHTLTRRAAHNASGTAE